MGRSVQETLPVRGSSLMSRMVPMSLRLREFMRKLSEQNGLEETIKEPSSILQKRSLSWWSTSAPKA